jgi:hypothetical protein
MNRVPTKAYRRAAQLASNRNESTSLLPLALRTLAWPKLLGYDDRSPTLLVDTVISLKPNEFGS